MDKKSIQQETSCDGSSCRVLHLLQTSYVFCRFIALCVSQVKDVTWVHFNFSMLTNGLKQKCVNAEEAAAGPVAFTLGDIFWYDYCTYIYM